MKQNKESPTVTPETISSLKTGIYKNTAENISIAVHLIRGTSASVTMDNYPRGSGTKTIDEIPVSKILKIVNGESLIYDPMMEG